MRCLSRIQYLISADFVRYLSRIQYDIVLDFMRYFTIAHSYRFYEIWLYLGFLPFLSLCLFVFLSGHRSDQMSEGSQISKVTICVEIPKWQSLSD